MSIKASSKQEGDQYVKNNITMYIIADSEGFLVSSETEKVTSALIIIIGFSIINILSGTFKYNLYR